VLFNDAHWEALVAALQTLYSWSVAGGIPPQYFKCPERDAPRCKEKAWNVASTDQLGKLERDHLCRNARVI
jgi:hypothetical protein